VNEATFTHTQFKTPVTVYADLVFAVGYMPTMKSVCLIATGGAAVPVEGTVEEVQAKITQAKKANTNPQGKE
jgi:hypothetical protein